MGERRRIFRRVGFYGVFSDSRFPYPNHIFSHFYNINFRYRGVNHYVRLPAMPESYIVYFANPADMIRNMRRRPPSKILALGFEDAGRCWYVGLCRQNGANYR